MMMESELFHIVELWAKQKLEAADAGHDWWHIRRVLVNARKIQKAEGGNLEIVELAVLLHDVADPKFFDEDVMLGEIRKKLISEKVEEDTVHHVMQIIRNLSFSKQWSAESFDSTEFRIVQDADRLDAIGAVGIARAFSYGGHKGRDFYDPDKKPQTYNDAGEYRNNDGTTINHFYEKLLLLKDMMKTLTGRQMADQRHEYMKGFLEQFYNEVDQE